MTEDRHNSQKEKNAGVFLAQAKRIATLRETDLDQYTTRQGTILYVDELDSAGHPRVFQSSFGYAVEFVTKKGQSDGPSNIARVAPIPIPGALTGIRFIPKPESIRLEWDAPKVNLDGTRPARIIGYNVYRSFESPPQFAHPLNASPIQTTHYEDHDFAFGKGVSYAVTVVGRRGVPDTESPLSAPLKLIPRDTFPPKTPERLQTLVILDAIHIRWNANTEADLAGYFIYRSEVEDELGIRLQEKPLRGTLFIDRSADLQKTYYYRVTAVDALANESQPTPPSSPSPPQDLEGVPVDAF